MILVASIFLTLCAFFQENGELKNILQKYLSEEIDEDQDVKEGLNPYFDIETEEKIKIIQEQHMKVPVKPHTVTLGDHSCLLHRWTCIVPAKSLLSGLIEVIFIFGCLISKFR